MTVKEKLLLIASTLSLFASCNEHQAAGQEDYNIPIPVSVSIGVKGAVGGILNDKATEIRNIEILSFAQKNDGSDYTYEGRTSVDIVPEQTNFAFSQIGSLPRIFYFIANGIDDVPYVGTLSSSITAAQFEAQCMSKNNSALEVPLTLVAKAERPTPSPSIDLNVSLSHTAACLTINNKYVGFAVDSLVLRDAVSGAFLFNATTPSAAQAQRVAINYGPQDALYLYQTDASTLTVYGKYNGIRAVFDIPLHNIKSGTRYKVSFRSVNDSAVDFAGNLDWSVAPWNSGATVESTPDWQ